jgi:homopolymeric O-antigen transport system permease protein
VAATVRHAGEVPVRTIRPTRGWASLELGELWAYRELVLFLTLRTILVRYKQTVLGVGWAVLQPFLLMVVLSVIFGRLAKVPSNGPPYPILAYAGLLPWLFFANAIGQSSSSLVGNANLLSKVYFPRLALPLSTVLAGFVDFLVASVLLAGLMAYYGVWPQPIALLLVPALIIVMFAAAIGMGCLLSAMNVAYRDIQYIVPFMTQIWFFLTVVYPASLLAEPWRTVAGINPMAGVVEGFRWALLSTDRSPGWMMLVSACVALVLLVAGLFYFRRAEATFADVV